jgi:DNA integrity scanning protein DisA with diadenylate cyclase activity
VSFRLHPDARDELREAVVFYDRAAERFVNAVETAIAAIILKPDRFREFEPGVRTCRVPKFPYSILYRFREHDNRRDFIRIFKSITADDIDRLVMLIRVAEEASHGALLIINENAAEESHRLRKHGSPIVACVLTPDLLRPLTTIDGAILLSPDGRCHSIGTILDGNTTEKGDPSRGARFNSAFRYAESHWPCMAVVVSEDGGIDLIPDLPPAVRRWQ